MLLRQYGERHKGTGQYNESLHRVSSRREYTRWRLL